MPEDIFEESTYTITATLKEGGVFSKAYTGKLDLTYKKGDKELHKDSDIEVTKGAVSKDYAVPKVEDTEENYTLKIIANYGKTKEKTRVLAEAIVWPKKVKLTVKDTKDDKPCKNLAYSIVHTKGKATDGHTDDNGVGNEDLKKCSYSIGIKAPFELVTNKNDPKKREHEITVRNNPVAKFLKPDITQAFYVASTGTDKNKGVRQYVNVATADEGCDAKGNIVEFQVCHKNQPQGINGEKIYIKVTFSKDSKRDDPKQALLAPAQGIAEKSGGKSFTGWVQLPSDGGAATFKVELGQAGGETVTVSCGYSSKDPSDATITIVTWRQLTYQLRYPALMNARMTQKTRSDASTYYDLPSAIGDVVKSRLAAVFVEYANIVSHEYASPAADAPSLTTRGYLECSADATQIYVLDETFTWLTGATAFDALKDDREITITLCDAVIDVDTKVLNPTFPLTKVETQGNIDGKAEYLYMKKRPQAGDVDNLELAGYQWQADLSGVADTDKMKKPTMTATFAAGDGGGPKKITVQEPTVGGPAITITFADKSNDLPPTEKARIQSYYDACFTDEKALRQAENKLDFTVTGSSGADGDDARQSAVTDAIDSIHTASDKKILFHPGIDDDGNPREGPMTDVTIVQVNAREMKFTFPTRASATDPLLPGDFVGDPSADKCPVEITISIVGGYTYNGHAANGDQLLVLRSAKPGAIAATVCHELGHSMGMSVMPPGGAGGYPIPPGLSKPKHVDNGGTYYRNSAGPYKNGFRNRHQGPHCCDGMPSGKKSDEKFKGWGTEAGDKVCIMWGEGGTEDDRTQFCTLCTTILKARNLTSVRKQWEDDTDG